LRDHAVEPQPAAAPAPVPVDDKCTLGPLSAGAVLRLQATAGNAAVGRLLSGRGRALQRQTASASSSSADEQIKAVARRAFDRGGPQAWTAAVIDILNRVVASRFPAEQGRVAATLCDPDIRGVRPGTDASGRLTLIGGDTVVRYCVNGFLEDLVHQVEAALLRDTLERGSSIVIQDRSENWSLFDAQDLQAALGLLTAAERGPLAGFRFLRESAMSDPDADALTTVDGTRRMIQLGDGVFGRRAGKSGGLTVFGRPAGVHGIVHECGHGIEFQNDAVLPRWRPTFNALRASNTRVSSQPKGDPARQPDFEVFAEAFARFHTDPAGLRTAAPAASAFFAARRHL
jgi:hypothetical protein